MAHHQEELLAERGTSDHGEQRFLSLTSSSWLIVLLILLSVSLVIWSGVLPIYFEDMAASVIAYCQATLWFICLICERWWCHQHHLSHTLGYLKFYRQTNRLRRLPLLVISAGSVLMLVIVTVVDSCKGKCLHLRKENYQQILVCIQLLTLIPILVKYLVEICRFNKRRPLPDVCLEEYMTSLFQPQAYVGQRDGRYLDEILEKQADMIRYLRQHNVNLGQQLLQLRRQEQQS